MVNPKEIGTVHWSKVLDRNVEIKEGPSDYYYEVIGLGSVILKEEVSDPKQKESRKKKGNDTDNEGVE